LPRPARPVLPRSGGHVDRLLDLLGAGLVHVREHMLLVVRHDCRLRLAGRHVLAADHRRDLDALAAHLLESNLHRPALRAAGRVLPDGLVPPGRGLEECVRTHGFANIHVAAAITQTMKPRTDAHSAAPASVQCAAASPAPTPSTPRPPTIPSAPYQR